MTIVTIIDNSNKDNSVWLGDLTWPKKTFAMLWHLRHWLQYWQLRTWIYDNLWHLIVTLDSIHNSCDVLPKLWCSISSLTLWVQSCKPLPCCIRKSESMINSMKNMVWNAHHFLPKLCPGMSSLAWLVGCPAESQSQFSRRWRQG